MNAEQMILNQRARIEQAAELLQLMLNEMTDTVDPSNCTWGDVANYAHVADAADCVIERLYAATALPPTC